MAILPSSRSAVGTRYLRFNWFNWLTRIANVSRKISVKYRHAEPAIQSTITRMIPKNRVKDVSNILILMIRFYVKVNHQHNPKAR
jgi:hypothetical protein